jgi:WD40 repeat protein
MIRRTGFPVAAMALFFTYCPAFSQEPAKDWTKPRPPVYSTRCLAFSPDGNLLAIATGDPKGKGKAIVWKTAEITKTLYVHETDRGVRSVAFSRDSKTLAAGGWSGDCYLLEAATGKLQGVLGGHGQVARTVSFSPDCKTLAVGGSDHSIHLWDYAAGNKLKTLTGHAEVLNCVDFAPDGKSLVSSANDESVRLWDPEKGKLLQTWDKDYGYAPFVKFGPGGTWVAVASASHSALVVRDVEGGRTRSIFGAADSWVAIHPTGKVVATSHWGDRVLVFPLDLREVTAEETKLIQELIATWQADSLKTREKASQDLLKLGWIADPFLAKAFKESQLAETRQRARQVRTALRNPADWATLLRGHENSAAWGAFSPDGQVLAAAGTDGFVILWDWVNGKIKAKLP